MPDAARTAFAQAPMLLLKTAATRQSYADNEENDEVGKLGRWGRGTLVSAIVIKYMIGKPQRGSSDPALRANYATYLYFILRIDNVTSE